MSLISSLLELRQSPEDPRTPLSAPAEWLFEALGASATDAGIRVSEKSSMTSVAGACANVLAQTVAQLPWDVYRQEDRNRFIADNRTEHWLLHNEPNQEMTSFGFRYAMMLAILFRGNFYARLERDGAGRVAQIWPLIDETVMVLRASDGRLAGYEVRNSLNGDVKRVLPTDMVHVPCIALNGTEGYSIIAQVRQKVALELAAEKFGAKFFGSGSRPAGILESDIPLNKVQRQELETQWKKENAGTENSNRTIVLPGGIKWKAITIPPDEAQFIETRNFQASDIARWFRVPGVLIGLTDKTATYASAEQFFLSFEKFTIQPWIKTIEQEFNRKLFRGSTTVYSRIDSRGLLRGDSAGRASYYNTLFNVGAYSPNDIRRLEDENPVEGGDVYRVPLNTESLQKIDEEPKPQEEDSDEQDRTRILLPIFEDAITHLTDKKPDQRDESRVKSRFAPLLLALAASARQVLNAEIGDRYLTGVVERAKKWSPGLAAAHAAEEMALALAAFKGGTNGTRDS